MQNPSVDNNIVYKESLAKRKSEKCLVIGSELFINPDLVIEQLKQWMTITNTALFGSLLNNSNSEYHKHCAVWVDTEHSNSEYHKHRDVWVVPEQLKQWTSQTLRWMSRDWTTHNSNYHKHRAVWVVTGHLKIVKITNSALWGLLLNNSNSEHYN